MAAIESLPNGILRSFLRLGLSDLRPPGQVMSGQGRILLGRNPVRLPSGTTDLTLLAEGRRNLHGVLEHVAHRNFGSLLSYFNPIKLPVLVRVQVSGAAQPRPAKWRRSTRPRTHSLLP